MMLDHEIRQFATDLDRSRRKHRRQEICLVSAAIALSACVTLIGVLAPVKFFTDRVNPGVASGVLGVVLSSILAIDRAFAFGERAVYSRILQAEAENLLDEKIDDTERQKQFANLRIRRAQARLGEGIGALQADKKTTETNFGENPK
jgi:hypothetical protein